MNRNAKAQMLLAFCVPLVACHAQERVEIANVMRAPDQYDGRPLLVHACVVSSTHGRSLFACEDSEKKVRMGFEVDEVASESSNGETLDRLSTEAWVPALRDRRIEVELEGHLVVSKGVTKLRVKQINRVTAGEAPTTPPQ